MTKMTQLRRTVLTCFVRVCLLSLLQSFLETTVWFKQCLNTSRLSARSSDLLRLQQKLMKLQQKQLQEQQHLQPQAQGSPESQAQTEMDKWTPLYIDICMIMYDIIDLYIIYNIYTVIHITMCFFPVCVYIWNLFVDLCWLIAKD
jgi:hypothetical protein